MTENEVKFAERLTELLVKAKEKKNVLNYRDIGDTFKGMTFTAEDAEKTLEFLEANGVDVLRIASRRRKKLRSMLRRSTFLSPKACPSKILSACILKRSAKFRF